MLLSLLSTSREQLALSGSSILGSKSYGDTEKLFSNLNLSAPSFSRLRMGRGLGASASCDDFR